MHSPFPKGTYIPIEKSDKQMANKLLYPLKEIWSQGKKGTYWWKPLIRCMIKSLHLSDYTLSLWWCVKGWLKLHQPNKSKDILLEDNIYEHKVG